MTQHRLVISIVAPVLIVFVTVAAVLWPVAEEEVPEVAFERDVLTAISETYRTEEAGFAIQFKDLVTPYRVMGTFVMPNESVEVEVVLPDPMAEYAVEASGGALLPTGEAKWSWQAPEEPGLYTVHVDERSSGQTITLNAFVKVPYDIDDQVLNGYRIGGYERTALRGDPVYDPPEGLVEVTPEVARTLVSPHFMLGQFLCKQESGYPKYLLLDEQLLLKLEQILKEVNERGIATPSLHVMSAYRTPFYNRSIGNRTSYSRHLYGDAADIFVDADDDNYMDDLTGDGSVTVGDASLMASIVDELRNEPWYRPLVGGLGVYSPAPHRGPFIHVDVRGKPVRW